MSKKATSNQASKFIKPIRIKWRSKNPKIFPEKFFQTKWGLKLQQTWEWFYCDFLGWFESRWYRFSEGCERLWSWIPYLINKDRDWDWAYTLDVIGFKIKRLQKVFKQCKMHDHSKEIKEIDQALKLMEPVKDDYIIHKRVFKDFDKKWGGIKFKKLSTDEWGNISTRLTHTKVKNQKQQEQCDKEARILYKVLREEEQKAKKLFWDYLSDHVEGWWC